MAEIDKALPNEVRKEINIPSIEDVQVEVEKEPEQKVQLKYNKTKMVVLI